MTTASDQLGSLKDLQEQITACLADLRVARAYSEEQAVVESEKRLNALLSYVPRVRRE